MDEKFRQKIINSQLENMTRIKSYGCKDIEAIRYNEINQDTRLQFQRDIDKIVYSKAFTRYVGKTQVYTLKEEDHISRRSTHVEYVSRIAQTIARALGVNEDLCEAIALGHDIGHVPFGHQGERVLNRLSKKYTGEVFAHNVQSIRALQILAEEGKGLNLTVQVLDGILCHNGEILNKEYRPVSKTKEEVMEEYYKCYKDEEFIKKLIPMTLEGCIVRISDIISYVGKDIEDAIILNKLKREDLPKEVTNILGDKNSDIIDNIIIDIIENSFGKDYISMSDRIYNALNGMIKFNYSQIYARAYTKEEVEKCDLMFEKLFEVYLKALNDNDIENDIIKIYYNDMNDEYKQNTSKERVVIDFIAGMTDRYMFSQYDKYCKEIK